MNSSCEGSSTNLTNGAGLQNWLEAIKGWNTYPLTDSTESVSSPISEQTVTKEKSDETLKKVSLKIKKW